MGNVGTGVLAGVLIFSFCGLSRGADDQMLVAMQMLYDRPAVAATSFDEMRLYAATIHPGMRRADVEALFPQRDSGPQSALTTRYYHPSGYAIIVPYDRNGGEQSALNRVSGEITLMRVTKAPY